MKRKLLMVVVMCLLIVISGITVLANTESKNCEYNSLLDEVADMLNPFSAGKAVKKTIEQDNTILKKFGDIEVSKKEVDYAKLVDIYNKQKAGNKNYITDDEVIIKIAKQKLLIADAKKRGISVASEQINASLENIRKSNGVNSNGDVTNDYLKEFLRGSGLTYDEYENIILKPRLEYYLLYYEYGVSIYNELKVENPNLKLDDEMISNYLQELLNKTSK